MSITRRKVENKISSKEKELLDLEEKILTARAEIKGMKEVLKMLPRDGDAPIKTILRSGSLAAKAHKVIENHGEPMYVTDILDAMNRAHTKKNFTSVSSVLSQYVRKDEIFTRPAPNTFGLVEWEKQSIDTEDEDDLRKAAIVFGTDRKVTNF